MSLFSFAGTVYFAVATAFAVIGSLIISISKNFTMLNRSLVIAVAASMVFAIVEAVALIIAISVQLNTDCLKKEEPLKNYFIASWVLIVVPIIVFSLIILAIVFGRSYLVSFESNNVSGSSKESPYDYLWQE
ncbi:hypothetical protein ANCCAN_22168 [Ancylostoma caninum]|nr:hypothetical protein ANCCAN_22168 [Ancylostoma caninum]